MPTFNRPADCVATLTAIGEDPLVLAAVHQVILPDQGTRKVRDEPGFAAAEAGLGGRLRIIDQPNLGGSGGYARVMYEALATPECQQILFMDDDILLEPDSVLRAVAFSRFAREPMLVGGQMLSLQVRSQLSTMGEVVDRHKFLWRNAPQTEPHHDLAERPLRQTAWLHRRVDVDYNAWWMCLIPRAVAEDVGLPLPLFIKWDDAEYGLRARSRGYRTATVPGIAIWHMSFLEKDDTSDWQAYFHYRNRLVAAAMHGPDDPKAAAHRHPQAHRPAPDAHGVLGGGAAAHGAARLPRRAGDAVPEPARWCWGRSARRGPSTTTGARWTRRRRSRRAAWTRSRRRPSRCRPPPSRRSSRPWPAASSATCATPDPAHHDVPQRNVSSRQAQWFVLSQVDSATVSTPDGRGVTFRRRDPQLFRSQLKTSAQLLGTAAREWPTLRRRYREAAPHLTSREGWKQIFEA